METETRNEVLTGLKAMFCAALVLAAGAAQAEIGKFPACPWSETKVVRNEKSVRVVDAAGRGVLNLTTEGGGNYARELVVSQSVDGLVIDARAAFKAGMGKLVLRGMDFDPAPYRGKDCVLVTKIDGATGTEGAAYFEGHGKNLHYYRSRKFSTKGHPKVYPFETEVDENIDRLHLRWDVTKASAKGPFVLCAARYGLASEIPVSREVARVKPELLFHATFDGTAEAAFAKGAKAPLCAKGLEYAAGRIGKAVRLTHAAKSVLAYATKDNLVQERGTVSFWLKREWPDGGRRANGGEIWRTAFSDSAAKGDRIGSGQLYFWFWGDKFRVDQSDDDDQYVCGGLPKAAQDGWTHLAVTWDEVGTKVYVNGRSWRDRGDGESPMIAALKTPDLLTFKRQTFDRFFVGNFEGRQQIDGLLDDLRVYSAPLDGEQVRDLYRAAQEVELSAHGLYALEETPAAVMVSATSLAGRDLAQFRYCLCDAAGKVVARFDDAVGPKAATLRPTLPAGEYALRVTDGRDFFGATPFVVMKAENPYELTGAEAAAALKAPGVLGDLELVETLKLDLRPNETRFRAIGPVALKSLKGTPYLEAGPDAGDRFAVRFDLGERAGKSSPLYVFEIDYPDDAKRTADVLVHRSKAGEYTMQVGYATGDEYPNTGRILTHRVLYWARDPDVSLVMMTARKGAPAAASEVRVYRVKGNALPAERMHEPKAAKGGWNRVAALYFEDPAIGYDFALPRNGLPPQELAALIDRTAALMKFTGENLFAYPGAWYHGLIGEDYNPRQHAPDFLSAWYAKFDREGLFVMPTVNPNTMPVPEDLVTRQKMGDGSLHDTVIAIHDTGKPNWGMWHDTPPNFNFHHPEVRAYIEGIVDALLEQGAAHPSFKGVAMHVARHCLLTFGDEASGYNDYTVEAFAKAKGLTVPAEFKSRPLRGADYAKWLRANAWEDWLQWRCDVVTDFYVAQAKKLAARRPDLKLWLNYMIPANGRHPDFLQPDFMAKAWRAAGLDPARLTREAPNVILGQTMVPADYRWMGARHFATPEAQAHQRVIDELPGFYANLKGASFPLVHQHDRYWESAIGRTGKTLTCDWLRECTWRVSTINPSGVNALRHFVEPLRFGDVLGVSKGGFLIGTYGMEDVLVPFLQAFRALPAVVMDDVAAEGAVRVRQCRYAGETYFYVVNTGLKPATVTLEFPPKTRNLVTGEVFVGRFLGFRGETHTLALAPYELRSFAAPKGSPELKR
jgi:hypothetical protein